MTALAVVLAAGAIVAMAAPLVHAARWRRYSSAEREFHQRQRTLADLVGQGRRYR